MSFASLRLVAPHVRRSLSSVLTAAFLAFSLAHNVRAQGNDLLYDAAATIDTDISGADVIVGGVNPNPFTVTIAPGAVITGDGDFFDGFGVQAYNQSFINVTGGSVGGLTFHDSSAGSVASGYTGYFGTISALDSSSIALSGGTISTLNLRDSASASLGGGLIYTANIQAGNSLTVSDGQIYQVNATNGGRITATGGGVSAYLGGGAVADFSGGSHFANVFSGGVADFSGTADGTAYANGGVVNVSGGSLFNVSPSGGGQLNLSGGEISVVNAGYGGTANITGGSVLQGVNSNAANVFISGGNVAAIDGNGVIQVSGGTVGHIDVENGGSLLVTGGTLTGNVALYYSAHAQFDGSGLAVVSQSVFGSFDGYNNYANAVYNLGGSLTDGSPLNTTVYAGASYSGDSSSLRFTGLYAAFAPDLYLTTDSAVNALYNKVVIGRDQTATINARPTVAFVAGADTGHVDVYNASAVTVAGGKINGNLNLHDNSAATITGGQANTAYAYDSSVLTVDGGSTHYATGYDQSVVNIVNGRADTAFAYSGATLNILGGSVGIAATNGGVINMTGGDVTYYLQAFGGKANISGGSLAGLTVVGGGMATVSGGLLPNFIYLGETSTLDLLGGSLNVTGATYTSYWDGQNNIINATYNVSGTLQSGDPLTTSIAAGGKYTGDSSALTFYGQGSVFAPDLYLTSEGTVADFYNHVVVGRDQSGTTQTSTFGLITAGADVGSVDYYNNSVGLQNGGIVRGPLTLHDGSQFFFGDGTLAGNVVARDDSRFWTFLGVSVNQIQVQDRAGALIYGSTISFVRLQDKATADIFGGSVFSLDVEGGTANVKGGSVYFSTVSGVLNVSGGSVNYVADNGGKVTVTGDGSVTNLSVNGPGSKAVVNGGSVDSLQVTNFAEASIGGGVVRTVVSNFGSHVVITGGQVGGFPNYPWDFNPAGLYILGGDLTLYGTGISYFDPMPGYYQFWSYGTYYTLQGRLADGEFLNTTLFLSDSAVISIRSVPEPGAVAFAVVAGMTLLGATIRRRRI